MHIQKIETVKFHDLSNGVDEFVLIFKNGLSIIISETDTGAELVIAEKGYSLAQIDNIAQYPKFKISNQTESL